MEPFIILLAIAYAAGSANFSVILFKILGKDDPRKNFSGNPGVTNVYRQAGIPWSALVLLLETGKALGIAVASLYCLKPGYMTWVGFSLVLGNRFPCFHRFRGGKGVANYLGFTAGITPMWAGISALTWVTVYAVSHIPFIASFFMIFVLALGTSAICRYDLLALAGTVVTVLFIYFNHKRNVLELLGIDY